MTERTNIYSQFVEVENSFEPSMEHKPNESFDLIRARKFPNPLKTFSVSDVIRF